MVGYKEDDPKEGELTQVRRTDEGYLLIKVNP